LGFVRKECEKNFENHCTQQSQRLQTGLRLRERNVIITSKWKGSYDSDRKYRQEWMGETFVQKAADWSLRKLWPRWTQSVPWKVREDQCSSTMPSKI